ncbi:hypothetical protein B0H17DRAFT_1194613 [Mycena rosella]|uniref:Uncharacterized protein n=1 Tax=Mycena rosella TaxID=1033263 RepID=A0AAD7GN28_MYCRO|nr:hypothetical protein B0H17DRAFT_1194613 [Mycena rosella]
MHIRPHTAPGTEASVPGTAISGSSDAQAVALQNMLAAMATFSQASQASTSAPVAAAIPTPAAPASLFRTRSPWIVGSLYVVPTAPLTTIAEDAEADPERLWYCITRGKYMGVTLSNPLALAATSGFSRGAMKSHKTQLLALEAFNEMLGYQLVAVVT